MKRIAIIALMLSWMCAVATADTISLTQHVVKVAVPVTDYDAANKLYTDQNMARTFTNLVLSNLDVSASFVTNGTLYLGTNAPPVGTPAIWASTGSLYWVADGVPVGYVNTNGIVLEQGTLQLYDEDLFCNVRLYDGSRLAPSLTFAGHPNTWGMYSYGFDGSYGAGWSQAGVAIGTWYGGGISLISPNAAFRGPVVGDLSRGTNYPEYLFVNWTNSYASDLANHTNTTLGAAHPVTADLNMKGHAISNAAQLEVNYFGNWLYDYPMLCGPDGKSMLGGFTYTESGLPGFLRSLTFPGLATVGGSFSPYNMSALTTFSAPSLQIVGGAYSPYTMQALTTLDLSSLQTVGSTFGPNTMNSLQNMILPALATVGGNFGPYNMSTLNTLSAPYLRTVGSSFVPYSMAALTTVSLPVLTTVGSSFFPNTMASLVTLPLPSLRTVGGYFAPYSMASLTALNLPSLTTVGSYFNPSSMTNLTDIVATNIVSIGSYVYLRGVSDVLGMLTNINIGTVGVTTNLNGSWLFSSNKLTIASISNNLVVLNSLDGMSGKQYWGTSMVYNVVGNTNAKLSQWSSYMLNLKTNIQSHGGTVLATP